MMTIAGAQGLIVGIALTLAGAAKLLGGGEIAVKSPLSLLVRRPSLLPFVWRGIGAVELLVGSLTLALAGQRWVSALSALLLVTAVGYAGWALRMAPGRPCGCFGAVSQSPITGRTIARAIVLALAAILGAFWPEPWWAALTEPVTWLVIVAEVLVLGYLSPEVLRIAPLRTRSHDSDRMVDCATTRVPLKTILARLKTSPAWQSLRSHIDAEDPREHWREGCWGFVCFAATYLGKPATAVFAIRLGHEDSTIRGALVDEANQEILLNAGTTA